MESHQKHVPNVISFQLVTGRQRWCMVGCYLAPRDAFTLEIIIAAIGRRHRGTHILFVGNLNTDQKLTDGNGHDKAI